MIERDTQLESFKTFLERKQLKHRTIMKYLNVLRRFSEQELGGGSFLPPPNNLKSIVSSKLSCMALNGKGVTTIRRELQVLNLFYSLFGIDCLSKLESPRYKNTAWLKTLKDAEIEKILAEIKTKSLDAYELYLLVLLTCMKPSEIIKLNHKDFQLDASYIKCGKRYVFLGSVAKEIFKGRVRDKKTWNKTLKSYEEHFRAACKKTGVSASPIMFRNTGAVKMLLAGQDLNFALNNMGVYSDRMRKNLAKALVRYED